LALVSKKIGRGRTGALLGPSGVGKSTLINQLCSEELQFVQPVRDRDQKGRHSTTERELIHLPDGGLMIDTPGLRELQIWEGAEGLQESFADIEIVARACRFSDCQHETEPGCAVLEALQSGNLDPGRIESHRKLKREMAWFERRQDARKQAEAQRRTKSLTKALRARLKEKGRGEDS
jgi:ribosome biogenesis GTPase